MFVHYLNLPQIPKQIVDNLSRQFDHYNPKVTYGNNTYIWSDSFNQEVNSWCQKNISNSMYFGFQIINNDLPIHKDVDTLVKINYILDPGGHEVLTNFWADDQTTLLTSYKINSNRWHILKADNYHSVENIQPNQVRFSITGRVFGLDQKIQ